jgi:ribosomal protein L22
MAEQNKKMEEKIEKSQKKELVKTLAENKSHDHEGHDHAHDHKHDHSHTHTEAKKEEKVEEKKTEKKILKKEEAIARGIGLPISKKHCMYICNFIKGKNVDTAIKQLEEVLKFKRAIPYAGEIPHRHGDMMSGRYPINASKVMITVLKGLRGNIITNGLDVEKARIYFGSATWGSRPAKKGGMRFKRVHLILKAKEMHKHKEDKK